MRATYQLTRHRWPSEMASSMGLPQQAAILSCCWLAVLASPLPAQSPRDGDSHTQTRSPDAHVAATESDSPREFAVVKTYNNSPFRYQMQRTSVQRSYQICRMTYPSPVEALVKQNNSVPADYYLPDGIRPENPKWPAVICIHILDGLGHYTAISSLPRILRRTVEFFAIGLPSGVKASEAAGTASRNPLKMVAELLAQAASMITVEPKNGRCHAVDLTATVIDKKGTTYEGSLRFTQGVGNRFILDLDIPKFGKVSLGQGEYPWMAAAKTVFRGVKGDTMDAIDPLSHADPGHLEKVRAVTGGLAALSLAPTILEQAVVVRDETTGDGPPRVRVAGKKNQNDYVRIEFLARKNPAIQEDSQTDEHNASQLQTDTFKESRTPQSATFDIDGFHGTVTFRTWKLNTEAGATLFEPPSDLPAEEVSSADLSRTFSAMFNFAMELLE